MPKKSEFADLYLYDRDLDKNEKYIDFRSHLTGDTADSNMSKIDAILKNHDLSINDIRNNNDINDSIIGNLEDALSSQGVRNMFYFFSNNSHNLISTSNLDILDEFSFRPIFSIKESDYSQNIPNANNITY